MSHQRFPSRGAVGLAVAVLLSLGPVLVAGQAPATQAGGAAAWTPPKTADGQPDLQGTWNYSTLTPLQRPAAFANKETFTEAEAEEFVRQTVLANNADRRDNDDRERIVNGTAETADVARAYNDFWWDRGNKIVATRRTSLIVDPPDGRLPALTADATTRAAARDAIRSRPAWGPEDRPPGERCIHQQRTGPPINPGGYNNNLQLVQAPGYVAILSEQIHEVRIIPLDGRPHLPSSVRQWKGDSRGRWEGNTLVVETVNFNDETNYQNTGEDLRLTERFTRIDPETILYEYTVTAPSSYERPWTVQYTWTRTDDPIFEYACHEGNYGIVGSLSGARAVEKRMTEEARKGSK
jgi:hypothetical protein